MRISKPSTWLSGAPANPTRTAQFGVGANRQQRSADGNGLSRLRRLSATTGRSLRSLIELSSMNIQEARSSDAPMIASVLQEAAEWLAADGRALWSAAEIGHECVLRDVSSGLFHVARQGEHVAGVMKFELEDAYFWPEVLPGTSAFVHKLAVRRAWAKKGVSTALLSYAVTRTQELGLAHLRLDCVADRQGLRNLYGGFGFDLHSVVQMGATSFARYQLPTAAP
jgi:GNAT superfamily N-acetyltransferase